MIRAIDVTSSLASTIARAGLGISVGRLGPRPDRPVELYEFEGCPYCRKTREALSVLDLDAIIYPCPKQGQRFRPVLIRRGGKAQFPYLVDPNTGTEMYESDDIIAYLFATYGDGRPPWALRTGILGDVNSSIASLLRMGRGVTRIPSHAPDKLLELWSFEGSPFSRIAREALTSLELPYVLHNVAKGSEKRAELARRGGRMMVPYLHDPNTGKSMYESADIVRYLNATYAVHDRH